MSRLTERIQNFNKAYKLFDIAQKSYIKNPQDEISKLAIVQAFEMVYELGWKDTPKDTIKSAFGANILPSAQIWIDMAQDRNASSHEYNDDKINVILQKISTVYYEELKRFKDNLGDFDE